MKREKIKVFSLFFVLNKLVAKSLNMHKKKSLELKIEKFTPKGLGIAFAKNNKVVIPNAIIGDTLLAELNKKRKGLIKARILEIIKPSFDRVIPKCEHFEFCGGCVWQNLKYKEQLKQKEKLIIDNFNAQIKTTNVKLYPIEPCENYFEYRNKMEFSFSQNRKNTKYLGLIMQGGRFVLDIQRCYLAPQWFSKVLNNIKTWWEKYDFSAFNYILGEGFLRTLTLKEGKNTNDKMIVLTTSDSISLSSVQKQDLITHIGNALGEEKNVSIFLNTQCAQKGQKTTFKLEKIQGRDFIKEDLHIDTIKEKIKLTFQIGPYSFFQPNTNQAQKLYSITINYLLSENLKDSIVFDLYSGTGTIGMILAKFVKKVIAVEINEDAANQAIENMTLNNIKNFEMINDDVQIALEKIINNKNFEKPHIIVVDPPRAGLSDEAIENILKISPKIILYISCNPITQSENINRLSQSSYQLKILHPIDQFPHTFHIENIAILKRA